MINIEDTFTPKVVPASEDYPFGSIKPNSAPGADDGTRLAAVWGNDYEGFRQKAMSDANLIPNGTPDTATNSQLLDAIDVRYRSSDWVPTVTEIGAAPLSHVGSTGDAHGVATQLVNGFISSTDKIKLDGIAVGANVGVIPNSTINSGTHTKITYDEKGLIVSGTDATTADILESTDKKYVSDAEKINIGNLSGINSGDETKDSIEVKLSGSSIVTTQGNTFNGNSELVQTTADGKLPPLDGSNLINLPSTTGTGESNTASNYGTSGTGLFDSKSGVDLRFKNIDSESGKISITANEVNHTVNLGVNLIKSDVGLGNVTNVEQLPLAYLDIDTNLTANSDTKVPSQKATKTYADTKEPLLPSAPIAPESKFLNANKQWATISHSYTTDKNLEEDYQHINNADRQNLNNLSGTNTGDETSSTILAKIGDGSKISSTYLPSYVDDVLEYTNLAAFPTTGEAGKIYVALDTNKTYRWSGSAYVYITSGAVDSVAGKTGVVTLVKADVGLSDVDNTSDINKPISTAQQSALDLKANLASPALTGTPSAPTATVGTSTTQIATTAFVNAEIANDAAPSSHVGATGTAHGVATTSVAGFMSAADKVKLDSMGSGGDYTHPASGVTAGTYKSVTVDVNGHVTSGTNPTTLAEYGITDAQALDADLTAIAALSGTSGLLKKTAANTWSLDTNTYITGNQNIVVSGDASGSGTTSIALTLANSGATAGTYKSVTVDAKGRVTAGTNPTTLAGYNITDAAPSTHVGSTGSAHGVATTSVNGFMSAADKTKLDGISGANTGDQTITLTGDVTGSGTGSFATTLANSGVTTGTYKSVTVDAKGRVITGSNPTTLAGYGITDAAAASHTHTIIGFSDTRSENFNPTSYQGLSLHLKENTTDGLADGGGYHGVLNLMPWNDYTGSCAHQLGFTDNGNMHIRSTADGTTFSSWGKVWTSLNDGAGSGLDADLLDGLSSASTNTASTVVTRDSSGNFSAGTITAALSGNASTATTLQTARTIATSGDVTGTATSFNGSANITIPLTLANSGVTTGTYKSVTVDAKGRVTAGTNPTTLAGYGITDAVANTTTINGKPLTTDITLTATDVGAIGATVATTTTNGLMSSTDKTKLDGIATGANAYVHPTSDGSLHVPATGTYSSGKFLKAGSTAGSFQWASLYKTDIGLGNVDNTSDLNKPISTDTQNALNGKANTVHTHTADEVGALAVYGTAVAASKLSVARTIAGKSFDGTADITISAADVGALASTGTAAAATKLATARTIAGKSFDGTANISITAADVGALATTGGTLSGDLNTSGAIKLTNTSSTGLLNSFGRSIARGSSIAVNVLGNTSDAMYFDGNSLTAWQVRYNSNLYNIYHTGNKPTPAEIGAQPATSDSRVKSNITSLPPVLDKIMLIDPKTFTIEGREGTCVGTIAQDWEVDFPEVILNVPSTLQGEPEMLKGIDALGTIGILLKAIQELKGELEDLKNR